ncbi:hypothetical protein BDN72DRAFT_924454 [Pluteus cervinus]|uniref:Uncharacterized protein n=1 Tax=Pluteus cervinus TaxID=181527 RepID=A0ACD3AGH7_9AGAR|nr:hypothetical protein BDN72DRAFT_924454 [Pluteus cervinus]
MKLSSYPSIRRDSITKKMNTWGREWWNQRRGFLEVKGRTSPRHRENEEAKAKIGTGTTGRRLFLDCERIVCTIAVQEDGGIREGGLLRSQARTMPTGPQTRIRGQALTSERHNGKDSISWSPENVVDSSESVSEKRSRLAFVRVDCRDFLVRSKQVLRTSRKKDRELEVEAAIP